jgi:hypothetical protein
MSRTALFFSLIAVGGALGCHAEETLNPLQSSDAGVSMDSGPDATPPPPPDAGTVRRTISERSPVGEVPNNLMADGDFELSASSYPWAQYPWGAYKADGSGRIPLLTETGGLCRTGLHCGVMTPKTVLLGRGAAAEAKSNVASLWAKITGGDCGKVRLILLHCDDLFVLKAAKKPKPEADGWCHYTAPLDPSPSSICMYLDNTMQNDERAILDSAVLAPNDGTIAPQDAEFWAPEPALAATLESLRDTVTKTTPAPRRAAPPPTP